jgi:hypothetical protein
LRNAFVGNARHVVDLEAIVALSHVQVLTA